MPLIERYIFKQLLGPTILAVMALGAVAVLSQSLSALDILVDQRQSPLIFAKITLLAMPMLISMILPVAVLVAALVALFSAMGGESDTTDAGSAWSRSARASRPRAEKRARTRSSIGRTGLYTARSWPGETRSCWQPTLEGPDRVLLTGSS